ncbi:carbohydrate sulfotransferase 4-like [Rhinatrema bivittatum]|uniref:carbohydrate sulfotransferase 4-like n=1 Tax=Rhinatrema bivittatum TaxID=194408 RepID=UPI00112BFFCC|nr:carbohydrate sulfotransferase 4-like [Rhinatrema bivittatum]
MPRRCTISRLCFLILALGCPIWYSGWKLSNLSGQRFASRPQRTQLLILSSWRSGSSFVGQLFNQNPKVFYLLEPTRHVWMSLSKKTPQLIQAPMRNLLRSIFSCNMSAFEPYIRKHKFVSNLFSWKESRALCSPPVCSALQHSDFIDRPKCFQICHQSPFEKIEEACRTYSHVVVKVVRFLDLVTLYPLLKDPSLNLKIIHLVRDPRAILSSRQHFPGLNVDDTILSKAQNSSKNISVVMQEICQAQVRIYKAASQNLSSFLKDRYLMVRYEDLVKDPLAYLREWYDYIGLSLSPKLESWVYNITHGTISNDRGLMHFSGDSLKIAQQWRKKLSFQKVKEVQKLCKQEMDMFGYQMVWDEEHLKNMSVDLISPQGTY